MADTNNQQADKQQDLSEWQKAFSDSPQKESQESNTWIEAFKNK